MNENSREIEFPSEQNRVSECFAQIIFCHETQKKYEEQIWECFQTQMSRHRCALRYFFWGRHFWTLEFYYNDKLASCSTYCRNIFREPGTLILPLVSTNILLKHILYYWSRNYINLRINDDVEVKPTRSRDFSRSTVFSKPSNRKCRTSDYWLVRGFWLNSPFSVC